jgi:hypothetical protein
MRKLPVKGVRRSRHSRSTSRQAIREQARHRQPERRGVANLRSGVNFEIIRGHLAAFAIGYEFEVHLLAFTQIAQSGAFHGTDVNERIRPTLIGCDEAEALLGIEPFDGAGWHAKPFQKT